MKPFLRRTKYCLRKQGECAAIPCLLFAVNFRATTEFLFFDEKLLCVCRKDRYLNVNPANNVQKKPVRETWRTPTVQYSL